MDIKEQIIKALGLSKELKLNYQSKSEDGTIFVSTADELASGVDISVLTEDGTTIPLPAGTYKTEEGVTFRVEEEGIVAEVMETETEETVTEEEQMAEEEADVQDWEGMEKRIKNLEDAIADLKAKVGEGKSEEVEMADEEATEEVVEEVVETVEAAVEEIAAAINEATPDEVTEEISKIAAEVSVEVMQEKAEEVVEEAEPTDMKKKKKDKMKDKKKKREYSKVSRLEKQNKELREKLRRKPADSPLSVNKFASERPTFSKSELSKMTKKEKFLYNLYK
jgi:molecular chaperone GrpE (heat shock protein)